MAEKRKIQIEFTFLREKFLLRSLWLGAIMKTEAIYKELFTMEFKKLTALLDRLPKDVGIPGCECIVHYKGKEVFHHAAGWRDVEAGEPVHPGDHYFLYSASKPATCAAALQLVEKGDLLLDDPIGDWLPAFKEMDVLVQDALGNTHTEKAKNPITVRHLFSMSAGLDYDLEAPAIRAARQAPGATTQSVVAAMAEKPLHFEPGTHWNYSLCHDVLAALVEAVSGERFADYVQKHIFAPCGMTESYYHMPPELVGKIAPQYRFNEETQKAERVPTTNGYVFTPGYDSGGAGVVSTLRDYAKFVEAMCHKGLAATGERILSPRAVDLMRTNMLCEEALKDVNWSQLAGYGYGLGVRTMMNPGVGGSLSPVGEFGWGGAAGAYIMIDPDNELSLFYVQHMLNNKEPYIHPRLRNALYADMADTL